MINEKEKKLIESLTPIEKDNIYRYLWEEYVRKDVEDFVKDNDIEIGKEEIGEVVNLYVYEGEYDCNFGYWENIDNIINKVKGNY